MDTTQSTSRLTVNRVAHMRLQSIDVLRGIAILGVVVFHFVWDLDYAGIYVGLAGHPAWLLFGRTLAGTFMFLVGISLVLAHTQHMRWRSFVRRLSVIVVSAALISALTYAFFPGNFVYFGILHAIAAATLIGVLFLRSHPIIPTAVGLVVILLPWLVNAAAFDTRWLAWIGFAATPPPSNDYVPIFPWVGLTIVAIGATKAALSSGLYGRIIQLETHENRRFLPFVWMGRHSLVIYLVHQPVLLAVILPFAR